MQFYTPADAAIDKFYQLPKALIHSPKYKPLTASAKLAYAILKDRHQLSVRNGWTDKQGHIYFLFSDKELAEILECSERTARRVKKELQNVGLIHMKRQGQKKANRIYLLKPEVDSNMKSDRTKMSGQKSDRPKMSHHSESDRTKMSGPVIGQKCPPNNTYINNTYLKNNNTYSSSTNTKKEEEKETITKSTILLLEELGYNKYIIQNIMWYMRDREIREFSKAQIITQHRRMILWVEQHGEIHNWGKFFVDGILKYENSRKIIDHMRRKKSQERIRITVPKPDYDWLSEG
jgi:hypothetical protein